MIWGRQKQLVEQLSTLAGEQRREAQRLRAAFRAWTRNTFGSARALAVSFAAGSLWAATGSRGALQTSRMARAFINTANTSWLLWRMAGRKVVIPGNDTANG